MNLALKVNGIDISDTFINMSKDKYKGKFVVDDDSDIIEFFEEQSSNLIYSRWSIIHFSVEDLEELMSKLHKILSNKGICLASPRGGDNYESINKTTEIRSLQMNKDKLLEIPPSTLEVVRTEMRPVKTAESDSDFAFIFVARKNSSARFYFFIYPSLALMH